MWTYYVLHTVFEPGWCCQNDASLLLISNWLDEVSADASL
jgi:hypothetical protein